LKGSGGHEGDCTIKDTLTIGLSYVRTNRRERGLEGAFFSTRLARMIPEGRREAFETEARRGFSQMRPTQAYLESVEEAEREKPRRARGSDGGAGSQESSGLGYVGRATKS
jgi:hypothetical protein